MIVRHDWIRTNGGGTTDGYLFSTHETLEYLSCGFVHCVNGLDRCIGKFLLKMYDQIIDSDAESMSKELICGMKHTYEYCHGYYLALLECCLMNGIRVRPMRKDTIFNISCHVIAKLEIKNGITAYPWFLIPGNYLSHELLNTFD